MAIRRAKGGGLEPSVSKPLLHIGAGVTWLVLAALSGLELSSRRVDGFVVATVAALAGSYCVCWVSMAVGRTKLVPPHCHYAFRHSGKTLATASIACGFRYCSLSRAFL